MTKKSKILLTFLVVSLAMLSTVLTLVISAGVNAEKFPVKLPGKFLSTGNWNQWIIASGTWTIDNAKPGAPFQTTEIYCDRNEKECVTVTAEIVFGTLKVTKDTHYVKKWDDTEIIAINDFARCFRYVYSINRLTEQVTGLRTKKPVTPENAEFCGKFSDDNLQLRLIDGSKWYWEEWSKAQLPLYLLLLPAVTILVVGLFFIWRRKDKKAAG